MSFVNELKRQQKAVQALGMGYLLSRRGAGPGVVRAKTRFGPLYFRPGESDLKTLWQTLGAREYDLGWWPQAVTIRRAYDQALAAGRTPVIIDAGANIGGASIWFSMEFPGARIFAVEPDPANAELCRLNTQGRNIEVVEAAIGAKPGGVSLVTGEGAWGVQTARGGEIPVVTVPDLLRRARDPVLLIAKIDIEGFEADLFSEATDWIHQATAVIIEPHDWMLPGAQSSRAFRAAMGPEFDLLISGENLVFVQAAPH